MTLRFCDRANDILTLVQVRLLAVGANLSYRREQVVAVVGFAAKVSGGQALKFRIFLRGERRKARGRKRLRICPALKFSAT